MAEDFDRLLRQFVGYDPNSGRFTWLERPGGRVLKGDEAGGVGPDGYRKITLAGHTLYAQNLAWFLFYGNWPRVIVDHIDCDPSNNRIRNLREANLAQNMWNTRAKRTNKLGLKGVSLCKQTGLYRAQIHKSGKSISLGRYASADEASAAYAHASARLFGEFGRAA